MISETRNTRKQIFSVFRNARTNLSTNKNCFILQEVQINGETVSLVKGYHVNGEVIVKRATDLFLAVVGPGFKVLYSYNKRLYIQLDPYFM